MLTVKQCRKLLGKTCRATDEEIETARDHLAFIAEIGIDLYLETQKALQQLTPMYEYGQLEDWDESNERPVIPSV